MFHQPTIGLFGCLLVFPNPQAVSQVSDLTRASTVALALDSNCLLLRIPTDVRLHGGFLARLQGQPRLFFSYNSIQMNYSTGLMPHDTLALAERTPKTLLRVLLPSMFKNAGSTVQSFVSTYRLVKAPRGTQHSSPSSRTLTSICPVLFIFLLLWRSLLWAEV
ncbi:hypothetical protein K438DRAFT_515261 [Mycena galopus ATCC 62051]|nr:hypothetical protein K438DRAFT_515261 [Mycena galopus ATCC 62051]